VKGAFSDPKTSFSRDYEQARMQFLDPCDAAGAQVESFKLPSAK